MKEKQEIKLQINQITPAMLHTAFMAGGESLVQQKKHLNKINVFPVADSDTGTNMAATMQYIMKNSTVYSSLKKTMDSIADSALKGARGNSGIIFAQYIHGIRAEMTNRESIEIPALANTINKAVDYIYDSVVEPEEGTIITVIEDWSRAVQQNYQNTEDFGELMLQSFQRAQQSLKETPEKLKILAQNNVVDAGAKGFVSFLEGVLRQIQKGKLYLRSEKIPDIEEPNFDHSIHNLQEIDTRYCTETLISNSDENIPEVRELLNSFGDSIIAAGSAEKMHLHIHTNQPGELFQEVKEIGTIEYTKVDDMKRQYQTTHNRKYTIGLIADSAADLPEELIEKYQINMIPFKIHFEDDVFLDKLTLTPSQFYNMLKETDTMPQSSQPDRQYITGLYDHLTTYYDKIISVHLSSQLSGAYNTTKSIIQKYEENEIYALDSKHLSASEGLITLRIARAIERGESYQSIIHKAQKWVQKTNILTDIDSLKYMVKGGRVSPLKGFLAQLINLKPIVSVNKDGKGVALGKSFSRRGNMKKIINRVTQAAQKGAIWNYAIVHSSNIERAQKYADKLESRLGFPPMYIVDISPVIGVHNGLGTVAITYMFQ